MSKFNLFVFFLFAFFTQPVLSQQNQDLPEGVMATRGEGSVSREVFDANMTRIPEKDRGGVLLSSQRVEKLLADLLLTSQLKADAHAAGFDQGSMQVRMQLAADKELITAWLDHYVDSQVPADYLAMAHEYYLLNKDSMMVGPTRDVTHLLVSKKGATSEEITKLAQGYLDEINQDPTVFDQLVMEHSEDPSVKNNEGHFKGIKEGDMVPSFEEAAFALKEPGDISGLVHSPYGIHIIRLDKINPPRIREFDEVKGKLVAMKEKEHKDRIRYSYLESLGSMEWHISEDELKAMVDRYFSKEEQEQISKGG